MPGRIYTSSDQDYKFGFNTQEKDDEIAGAGNHIDFKFRGYDPRTGRFWSVDPLYASYPWNSTYAFAENDVIRSIDLEGKERWISTTKFNDAFDAYIKVMIADKTGHFARENSGQLQAKYLDKTHIIFTSAGSDVLGGAHAATISRGLLEYATNATNNDPKAKKYFDKLGVSASDIVKNNKIGISTIIVAINTDKIDLSDICEDKNQQNKLVKSMGLELILHVGNIVNGVNKGVIQEHQEGYNLKNNRKFYTKYEQDVLENTDYSPERAAQNSKLGKFHKAVDDATK